MAGQGQRTGTVLGPYAIGELLGRGGMGEVYRAHDQVRDRDVALKVLHASAAEDPDFRARFTRESQTVARLADPHVIPIHDFGEIDGVLFLDMRLVDGRNLAEILSEGALAPERAVSIVEQVAGALDDAHSKGLVHRDVKPSNIEVTASGFPYLLDFGLAVADTQTRMTSAGIFVGSQGYAAPERFDGDSATVASDVYSLACVLFETLTGRPPYRGESIGALLKQHLAAPIPRPSEYPGVPTAMDSVIAAGMAKEPAARFASCGALAAAARSALGGRTPTADSATVIRPLDGSTGDPTVISTPGHSPAWAQYPAPPSAPQYAAGSYPAAPPSTSSAPGLSYPQPQQARSSKAVPILATVAAVLVGATAVLGYFALSDRSASSTPAAAPATVTTASKTEPEQSVSTQTTTTSAAATSTADAAAALRARAAGDRTAVLATANNEWVAQLSTKYAGLNAEGRVWDDAAILGHVDDLDRRYGGVRLLYTDQWPVFELKNAWVVISSAVFSSPDAALSWCRMRNLDNDNCFGKLISDTRGPEGTTRR